MTGNFFVQVIARVNRDDILYNQLYLSKFANVDMDYTDQLTLQDIKKLTDKTEEWEKSERKAKVKLEESKLKSLFKGLSKMFGKR